MKKVIKEDKIKEDEMKEVIERLRKESAESQQKRFEQRWSEEGRREGLSFAKNVHYDTLQEALSWNAEDRNFSDTLEAAYQDADWGDIFDRLRERLGVRVEPSLDESPMFRPWSKGFMEGVRQFWREVVDKV